MGTRESMPLQESNITSLETKSSDNHEDVGAPFIHMRKKSSKSEHPQDLTRELSAEVKDDKDNVKHETQEECVERIEKQQEEVNEVKDQSNDGFIRSIILECIPEPDKIKCTNIKKEGNSGQSSGYSSDLEEDQHPKSKNAMLPQQSPTGSAPATKMDNVGPVNGKVKTLVQKFRNTFNKKNRAENI
ncbi:MAG: hypothetical protein ACR5K9_04560 [Wolbachia sp.]